MTKIIIQGNGIVGQATEMFLKTFNNDLEIAFNDPVKSVAPPDDAWAQADYVIVCVNTNLDETLALPENSTTNIDSAINFALSKGFLGKIVLRSTIGMECVNALVEQLGQNLIVWPEFIREATWQTDSTNPSTIIVGGEGAEQFASLFDSYYGNILITDPTEAMIAKLSTNTFLAMKVIFANQVRQLCDMNRASYDVVKLLLENEGRLGNSHWDAPGPDGQFGFGGKCFPKDVKTFETALVKSQIHIDLVRAISDINDTLRSNGNQ